MSRLHNFKVRVYSALTFASQKNLFEDTYMVRAEDQDHALTKALTKFKFDHPMREYRKSEVINREAI